MWPALYVFQTVLLQRQPRWVRGVSSALWWSWLCWKSRRMAIPQSNSSPSSWKIPSEGPFWQLLGLKMHDGHSCYLSSISGSPPFQLLKTVPAGSLELAPSSSVLALSTFGVKYFFARDGDCPVHCRVFSSISGLYLLGSTGMPTSQETVKWVHRKLLA